MCAINFSNFLIPRVHRPAALNSGYLFHQRRIADGFTPNASARSLSVVPNFANGSGNFAYFTLYKLGKPRPKCFGSIELFDLTKDFLFFNLTDKTGATTPSTFPSQANVDLTEFLNLVRCLNKTRLG
jgi:hypothetical protein